MIKISDEHYLGRGIAKIVYRHPHDSNICIKFPNKSKKRALNDILREIKYLQRHQDNLPWLSRYLGTMECNLGIGYVYEMAKNEDGSLAVNIAESERLEDYAVLGRKVGLMYRQLVCEHAVVNDLSLSNIYVAEKKGGDFDLILIDGFGNSDFVKIADYSKYFLVQKLNRKFSRLSNKLGVSADFLNNV